MRAARIPAFDRTFHPDEANQAFTTGRLLETGVYAYDPQDHHGPTLYYAAAAIQKAAGSSSTAALDGTLLRCTPLLFAALAIVFAALAARKLTNRLWPGVLSALLLGTAPIFAFFATDFIQEMLLASFTVMMLWSGIGYWHSMQPPVPQSPATKIKPGTWALLFGIAAGLAFATKETSIIAFAAAGLSLLAIRIMQRDWPARILQPTHAVLAILGFLLTTALLYSSFAANWQGVYNIFIAAPISYLQRAAGSAASQGAAAHVHPWWQYLKWLLFSGWQFSAIPAALLFAITFRRRSFLHIYSVAALAIYSLIPYKTPWCALQIAVPAIIAACIALPKLERRRAILAYASITAALAVNICGLIRINSDPDSKTIPYNYASASPQVKDLADLILLHLQSKPKAQPASRHMPDTFAAVALPPEDTWPLPFYLREVGGAVGYWTSFAELEALAGLGAKPSVVVVPAEEGHLVQPIFPHLKNTRRFEMRPRVRIRAFW